MLLLLASRNDAPQHGDAAIVGRKATGLLRLPEDWTPPYFILTTAAHAAWIALSKQASGEGLREAALAPHVRMLLDRGFSSALVRSSSITETMEDRGRFQSEGCPLEAAAILSTAQSLWRRLEAGERRSEAPHEGWMALIVQALVPSVIAGHLSNERRVSKEPVRWVCEWESTGAKDEFYSGAFWVRERTGVEEVRLCCPGRDEIDASLRSIASAFSGEKLRRHFEWLWDGKRIWIVQCDEEEDRTAQGPRSQRVTDATLPGPISRFKVLRDAATANGDWPKAECVATFAANGLPHGNVYILESPTIIADLAQNKTDAVFSEDLALLLTRPIVIRSDITRHRTDEEFLLPRTDKVSTVSDAISFLSDKASAFLARGLHTDEFCFLLHQFIPARSCAIAYSKPGVRRVRVDSTWGIVDSLLFYPHDSFEVDARSNQVLKTHLRCKTEYIDTMDNGRWVEVRNGRPWDWKPSLSADELVAIAGYSSKISQVVGAPLSIMYFVGTEEASGESRCLPWFFTMDVTAEVERFDRPLRFTGTRIAVTTDDDLRRVDEMAERNQLRQPCVITIRPRLDSLRSSEFLERIGAFAKRRSLAIELDGSVLSHAYYILRRARARVRCVDPFTEAPDRQEFGKLVRDLIPRRILSHGEEPRVLRVTAEQLLKLLSAKAIEEALELFWETAQGHLLDELADVYEVLDSIRRLRGWTGEDVQGAVERKRGERGGFDEGIVLVETQSVPLIDTTSPETSLFRGIAFENTPAERNAPFAKTIAELRKPRTVGNELIVSLVPPDNRGEPITARLPHCDQNIRIVYDGTEVRLRVAEPETEQPARREHRQLFFSFYKGE
jgi:predicted house-cleaning noncanonical NTP pyrophosphatase (MazG superfamily)